MEKPQAWRWSSVAAHLAGEDDELVRVAPVLERYRRFSDLLDTDPADASEGWRRLRMSETSGRPLGSEDWIEAIEARTGRTLKPRKRGRKPRSERI